MLGQPSLRYAAAGQPFAFRESLNQLLRITDRRALYSVLLRLPLFPTFDFLLRLLRR